MENPFAGMSLQELLEAERALKRAYPVRYWLAEAHEFLKHPVSSIRAWRRLRILRPLLDQDTTVLRERTVSDTRPRPIISWTQ